MTAPDQASPAGQEVPPTCYQAPGPGDLGLLRPVRSPRLPRLPPLRRRSGSSAWSACATASRGTRQARTAFGGRPVATAAVTWTLVGINVLLFLVELAKPSLANDWGLLGYAPFSAAARCRASRPASGTG